MLGQPQTCNVLVGTTLKLRLDVKLNVLLRLDGFAWREARGLCLDKHSASLE